MGGEKGATGKNLLENQKQMTDQSSATLGDTDYRGERTLIHMFPIIKVPPEKWMFLNFKSPENYEGGDATKRISFEPTYLIWTRGLMDS